MAVKMEDGIKTDKCRQSLEATRILGDSFESSQPFKFRVGRDSPGGPVAKTALPRQGPPGTIPSQDPGQPNKYIYF